MRATQLRNACINPRIPNCALNFIRSPIWFMKISTDFFFAKRITDSRAPLVARNSNQSASRTLLFNVAAVIGGIKHAATLRQHDGVVSMSNCLFNKRKIVFYELENCKYLICVFLQLNLRAGIMCDKSLALYHIKTYLFYPYDSIINCSCLRILMSPLYLVFLWQESGTEISCRLRIGEAFALSLGRLKWRLNDFLRFLGCARA